MAQKIFDFCRRFNVGITGSDFLLGRIAGNIETENQDSNASIDAVVEIHEPEVYKTIVRDKRYPYLTVNTSKNNREMEYYRYNTFVRKIRILREGLYTVEVNIEGDESAGLICFRHFCNNHPSLIQTPLLHASLVNLGNEGILISGDTRTGKTSLMVYLMEYLKAGMISEDNVYLEKDMAGIYYPKVPRVRFSTVRDSCLSPLLKKLEDTQATQYWDVESIEKVVSQGTLDIDGGLAISRRKIAEMCGVETSESVKIEKVIFPSYSEGELFFEEIEQEEGFHMLEKFGREKKKNLDPREIDYESIDLTEFERKNIRFYTLKFSGIKALVNRRFAL